MSLLARGLAVAVLVLAAAAPAAVAHLPLRDAAGQQQPLLRTWLTEQGLQGVMPGAPQIIPDLYGGPQPRRAEPPLTATPKADCGPGSRPETNLQGRVPKGAKEGFTCNAELIAKEGATGGFKVERYVDKTGRQCAYYDTALVFPLNVVPDVLAGKQAGTAVIDMSDPRKPVRTTTLQTPAMLSPHESLLVHQGRGLLAAGMGTPATAPAFVDLYDLSEDCRYPKLLSSRLISLFGHESGFAPDGKTFYVTSLFTNTVAAIDVSDPRNPRELGVFLYPSHGFAVSDDGTRGYVNGFRGLQVVDLTDVQQRKPNPKVPQVSGLSWRSLSIPQNAVPVTIGGRRMLVENDEFAYTNGFITANGDDVGAGRIIDLTDETAPRVVSNLRLEVHQPEHRKTVNGDPGTSFLATGYAMHYCGVPKQVDPGIVACSSIGSGLRVFDIRDPFAPREIAYYVGEPRSFLGLPGNLDPANFAMSRPAFDEANGDIWYSDANAGLRVVHLTNGVWPFAPTSQAGLPATDRCLSRRRFPIRLGTRRTRLRSATVTLNGKRVRVRRSAGRLVATVDLRGRPRQTVTVRVVARTKGGRTLRETRRYRTCTKR
ncbi:LVIVD repeat-containing protein [Conexibacter sp. SYSU D00693]|uniref:LVIVD repeat-containing protein n=1 Tax=Conexibacter sp. SYSU D00693 TaxID=2812560 RepID=UPI00196A7AF5|nr:hypothetical protein [Conexibacter sp. SYSU D00693]